MTDAPPADRFSDRHIGPRDTDRVVMLATLGFESIDDFIDAVVPDSIRAEGPLALPSAVSEVAALDELRALASRNRPLRSCIGAGYSGTITPPVILRNILENPAWYTAYTPYQPEISQGRLEALLNFQTMICDLTGMDIANASMLDEGTAAAEAMTMARRASKSPAATFIADAGCHPQTIEVLRTRAEPLGIEVVVADPATAIGTVEAFGVLLASPSTTGELVDPAPLIAAAKAAGQFVVVACDLLASVLVTPPGELGADAVVGSAQRFGVPMGFGGPHAGFLATADAHKRTLPGRLVGVSVDTEGRRALRLALQTREQHIRREKATSNICTAQVLLAVMSSMYAVYHGPDGLRRIAERTHHLAGSLAAGLADAGLELVHDRFFDTVTVRVGGEARRVVERAHDAGYLLRCLDADTVAIALDETTDEADVATLAAVFDATPAATPLDGIGDDLRRRSDFLTHPTFARYHSETEMLRYLRRLADADIALDRAMIPLGSCTMKLNATTEMIPVTWPEFSDLHPFAPDGHADGYLELFEQLESWLAEITGYDAVSLQPNAGSQGELAGLLAIRAYHHSRGDSGRDICLIPSSAHGTNAASAVMAGMRVVVVGCDDQGNVDLADLRAKIATQRDNLAALMITYPSTHGVFEESIREICDLIHDAGGQVYLDGANMNALVGLARPGRFGADVSHLNLHKTFCIPHGGGGPGVGPIALRSHLAPFLPGRASIDRAVAATADPGATVGPVAAAPWGSASILPIPWTYIRMMGPDGLRRATEGAILAANYVAKRLEGAYPVLYSGRDGLVAHECIIDIRPIEKDCGVTGEDIAKRLIDYGFHAPTMSFPVAGTLMIEPTESESLAELDRFCDALLAIRAEIERVHSGEWPLEESPLRRAPHPAEDVIADDWARPYSRELAAYPVASLRTGKYWVPVSRVDNGYGDRNLMCSCPAIEDLAEQSV